MSPELERFWSKVRKTDACWLWIAGLDRDGYGKFRYRGKDARANRVSYELHYGPLPINQCALHTCDNPRCVRPDHLFAGTVAQNNADMACKQRGTIGESNTNAKLTRVQVTAIRESQLPFRQIAHTYNVSDVLVGQIKRRKIWRHVA